MRTILLPLCGILCLLPLSLWAQTIDASFNPTLALLLQAKLNSIGSNGNYQGISVALQVPGQGLWVGTYGEAQLGTPLLPNMRLGWASNSKALSGTLLLKLQEEGLLDFESPIGNYLPDYPQVDPNITVKQLLYHTSGLFDFINDWSPQTQAAYNVNPNRVWTMPELLGTIGPPTGRIGERYAYSNTNYLLAGMLAEAVTTADIGELFHQYIFDPLGLSMAYPPYDTVFNEPYANLWNTAGTAVVLNPAGSASFQTFPATAGAIWATPADMARWYAALFGDSFLHPESQAWLRRHDGYIPYTTGLRIRNQFNRSIYYHGGAWGFRSYMLYDPSSGISLALASNQYGTATADPALSLFEELLNRLPRPLLDAKVVEIENFGSRCAATDFAAVITNRGQTPITSLQLAYGLTPNWLDTLDVALPNPLAYQDTISVDVPLTPSLLTATRQTLQVKILLPQPDLVPANDLLMRPISYFANGGEQLPFYEDFEATGSFPTSLLSYQSHNALDWQITDYTAASGQRSLGRINYYDANIGQLYAFELPLLQLPAAPATLSFSYAHTIYPGQGKENLRLYASTDCGQSFTPILQLLGDDLLTAAPTTDWFLPNAADWQNQTIDLTAFAGQAVLLRFELENAFGTHTYLDDIQVTTSPLATQSHTVAQGIQVFPNPVGSVAYILAPSSFHTKWYRLLDSFGREVTIEKVNSTPILFRRGQLAAGTYWLQLIDENGRQLHTSLLLP